MAMVGEEEACECHRRGRSKDARESARLESVVERCENAYNTTAEQESDDQLADGPRLQLRGLGQNADLGEKGPGPVSNARLGIAQFLTRRMEPVTVCRCGEHP